MNENIPVFISSPSNVYLPDKTKFPLHKKSILLRYSFLIRDLCRKYEDENIYNPNSDDQSNLSLIQPFMLSNTQDLSFPLGEYERISLEAFHREITKRANKFREFNSQIRQIIYEYLMLMYSKTNNNKSTESNGFGGEIGESIESSESNSSDSEFVTNQFKQNTSQEAENTEWISTNEEINITNGLSLNTLLSMYFQSKGTYNPIHYALQLLKYEEKRFIVERQLLYRVNMALRRIKNPIQSEIHLSQENSNLTNNLNTENSNLKSNSNQTNCTDHEIDQTIQINQETQFSQLTNDNHVGILERNVSSQKIAMLSNVNVSLNQEVNRQRSALQDIQMENNELKRKMIEIETTLQNEIEKQKQLVLEERKKFENEMEKRTLFKQGIEEQMNSFSKELEQTNSDYKKFMDEYNELKKNKDTIKSKYRKKLITERQRQKELQDKVTFSFQNQSKIYEEEIQELQEKVRLLQTECQFMREEALSLHKA